MHLHTKLIFVMTVLLGFLCQCISVQVYAQEKSDPLSETPMNGSYMDMMYTWLETISHNSIRVDQLPTLTLKVPTIVGLDAYLYVGDYSVRLSKVRVGTGKNRDFRIATLGTSDKANLYSQTSVFNCRRLAMRTVEVVTYPNLSERMFSYVPKPSLWVTPKVGSGQYWLINAICSANPVTLDDNRTVIGYSVQSNRLL